MKCRTIYKNLYLFVVIIIFSLAACGTDADGDLENNNDEPAPNEVWMIGVTFEPGDREIEAGTTVTWINQSNLNHTVTSGPLGEHDGQFDSGNLTPGEQYEYTFSTPGVYPYYCRPHELEEMAGTIFVVESNGGDGDNGDY